MYKIRKTTRNVAGTPKAFKIYTFTGTAEEYDRFRDLRTDAGGRMRKEGPVLDINGTLEPSSFEIRCD